MERVRSFLPSEDSSKIQMELQGVCSPTSGGMHGPSSPVWLSCSTLAAMSGRAPLAQSYDFWSKLRRKIGKGPAEGGKGPKLSRYCHVRSVKCFWRAETVLAS